MKNYCKLASYLITATLIFLVLTLHLSASTLIGLLIFCLTYRIVHHLKKHQTDATARWGGVFLMVTLILLFLNTIAQFLTQIIGDQHNINSLMSSLEGTVEEMENALPTGLKIYIPKEWLEEGAIKEFAMEHTKEIGIYGRQGLHTVAQILITSVIGLLLNLHKFNAPKVKAPLAFEMQQRFQQIKNAFENIVFAQVTISAINATLTGVFLLIILPLLGIQFPYCILLIGLTFLIGLIPILGNLISNTVITLIGISISVKVAIFALTFLVFIHKLEYFINAKIVGRKIDAKAWEILISLFLMEAIFGITGLLFAPILYAYVKSELTRERLI